MAPLFPRQNPRSAISQAWRRYQGSSPIRADLIRRNEAGRLRLLQDASEAEQKKEDRSGIDELRRTLYWEHEVGAERKTACLYTEDQQLLATLNYTFKGNLEDATTVRFFIPGFVEDARTFEADFAAFQPTTSEAMLSISLFGPEVYIRGMRLDPEKLVTLYVGALKTLAPHAKQIIIAGNSMGRAIGDGVAQEVTNRANQFGRRLTIQHIHHDGLMPLNATAHFGKRLNTGYLKLVGTLNDLHRFLSRPISRTLTFSGVSLFHAAGLIKYLNAVNYHSIASPDGKGQPLQERPRDADFIYKKALYSSPSGWNQPLKKLRDFFSFVSRVSGLITDADQWGAYLVAQSQAIDGRPQSITAIQGPQTTTIMMHGFTLSVGGSLGDLVFRPQTVQEAAATYVPKATPTFVQHDSHVPRTARISEAIEQNIA